MRHGRDFNQVTAKLMKHKNPPAETANNLMLQKRIAVSSQPGIKTLVNGDGSPSVASASGESSESVSVTVKHGTFNGISSMTAEDEVKKEKVNNSLNKVFNLRIFEGRNSTVNHNGCEDLNDLSRSVYCSEVAIRKKHTPSTTTRFEKCPLCYQTFTASEVANHGCHPQRCRICSLLLKNYVSYQMHMEIHKSEKSRITAVKKSEEKGTCCKFCNSTFTKKEYASHAATCGRRKTKRCTKCNIMYSTSYARDLCGKCFKTASSQDPSGGSNQPQNQVDDDSTRGISSDGGVVVSANSVANGCRVPSIQNGKKGGDDGSSNIGVRKCALRRKRKRECSLETDKSADNTGPSSEQEGHVVKKRRKRRKALSANDTGNDNSDFSQRESSISSVNHRKEISGNPSLSKKKGRKDISIVMEQAASTSSENVKSAASEAEQVVSSDGKEVSASSVSAGKSKVAERSHALGRRPKKLIVADAKEVEMDSSITKKSKKPVNTCNRVRKIGKDSLSKDKKEKRPDFASGREKGTDSSLTCCIASCSGNSSQLVKSKAIINNNNNSDVVPEGNAADQVLKDRVRRTKSINGKVKDTEDQASDKRRCATAVQGKKSRSRDNSFGRVKDGPSTEKRSRSVGSKCPKELGKRIPASRSETTSGQSRPIHRKHKQVVPSTLSSSSSSSAAAQQVLISQELEKLPAESAFCVVQVSLVACPKCGTLDRTILEFTNHFKACRKFIRDRLISLSDLVWVCLTCCADFADRSMLLQHKRKCYSQPQSASSASCWDLETNGMLKFKEDYNKNIKYWCKKCGYGCHSRYSLIDHPCKLWLRNMSSCKVVLEDYKTTNRKGLLSATIKQEPVIDASQIKKEPTSCPSSPDTLPQRSRTPQFPAPSISPAVSELSFASESSTCYVCGESFATVPHFEFHLRRKHGITPRQDRSTSYCTACKTTFSYPNALDMHRCKAVLNNLACSSAKGSACSSSAIALLCCEKVEPCDDSCEEAAQGTDSHLGNPNVGAGTVPAAASNAVGLQPVAGPSYSPLTGTLPQISSVQSLALDSDSSVEPIFSAMPGPSGQSESNSPRGKAESNHLPHESNPLPHNVESHSPPSNVEPNSSPLSVGSSSHNVELNSSLSNAKSNSLPRMVESTSPSNNVESSSHSHNVESNDPPADVESNFSHANVESTSPSVDIESSSSSANVESSSPPCNVESNSSPCDAESISCPNDESTPNGEPRSSRDSRNFHCNVEYNPPQCCFEYYYSRRHYIDPSARQNVVVPPRNSILCPDAYSFEIEDRGDGTPLLRYVCRYCFQMFSLRDLFLTHMNTRHNRPVEEVKVSAVLGPDRE